MTGRPSLRTTIRIATGLAFVAFGAAKFVDHPGEAASFAAYGLPWPGASATAIGVLETAGGLALVSGVRVRATALLLACDMVGAITVAGIARGEWLSLTVAPALLVATLAPPAPPPALGRRLGASRLPRRARPVEVVGAVVTTAVDEEPGRAGALAHRARSGTLHPAVSESPPWTSRSCTT